MKTLICVLRITNGKSGSFRFAVTLCVFQYQDGSLSYKLCRGVQICGSEVLGLELIDSNDLWPAFRNGRSTDILISVFRECIESAPYWNNLESVELPGV